MTMNESLLNDIRATINWAAQSQTNIGAAYSVLETLVKDIEKSLLDEDNDQLQEWLNTLILVWQSLAATDEFYLAGVSSRLRDAEYKAVDLWKEAEKNDTEA